tara:strand:+ start:315 stop:815 length:501 start_codon:yes stop_codon:yes gene_type:complete
MIQFEPMLTPREMLSEGVFGGAYFNDGYDLDRLPGELLEGIDPRYYSANDYQVTINRFKIRAGQSLQDWQKNGWIHPDDSRGWFEWYCKYFYGRRHEDDDRQIKRWAAFCGPKGRWRNIIYKKIQDGGLPLEQSSEISPRVQQSLMHWAYLVNQSDYASWLETNSR